jgi:proline iminopeptidase
VTRAGGGGEKFVVQAEGAVLRGSRRGSGPVLVLLHGGPGCYDYFSGSALVEWLASLCSVCAYDQRGCRDSVSEGPYTIDANVQDLEAIRRWAGAERVDLLGHSAGAMLATCYAAVHPDRVDRLILMSPAGLRSGWRAAFEATIRQRLTPSQERRLAELDRRILATKEAAARARLYRDRFNAVLPCHLDPRHRGAAPRLDYYSREVNMQTTASIQESYREDVFKRRLSQLAGAACIIHGRSDPIPWRVVEDYQAILPNAKVVGLEHCGHFPWLEEPEACREELFAFLGQPV